MAVNPYNKYIKQYQANNVTTANPEKLMIMLFDAAIQNLKKAITAIDEKKLEERYKNIENARNILREFQRTIDLENGNDVSRSLFTLYSRMAAKLLKANIKRDKTLVQEVLNDFENVRWGFVKAIEINHGSLSVDEAMEEYNKIENLGESPEPMELEDKVLDENRNEENAE